MPWPTFQNMTDHDLDAIYEYLSAIPCMAGRPVLSGVKLRETMSGPGWLGVPTGPKSWPPPISVAGVTFFGWPK
jgi:hypothetical protein